MAALIPLDTRERIELFLSKESRRVLNLRGFFCRFTLASVRSGLRETVRREINDPSCHSTCTAKCDTLDAYFNSLACNRCN